VQTLIAIVGFTMAGAFILFVLMGVAELVYRIIHGAVTGVPTKRGLRSTVLQNIGQIISHWFVPVRCMQTWEHVRWVC
jgi:hypothetical protein